MPLPNFRINPYVKSYQGGISSEYGQAVQSRVNQFYQNAEADDVLGYQADTLRSKIAPFDNDQLLAGQHLDKVRGELKDRAAKGDYENMFREVKRSARNFSASVEPLLQNRAIYDSYLKDMKDKLDKGTIGRDTYEKSIQHSLKEYKGYNPTDTNSFFKGYSPSADISIADKLNKFFGDTFKGDKVAYDIINPITGLRERVSRETNEAPVKYGNKYLYFNPDTNSYNLEGEGRKISQVELAGRQFVQGDKDVQNYMQNQGTIGNSQRVFGEMNSAIQAESAKLGYNINTTELEALPAAWLTRYDNQVDMSRPYESASEVPSENKHLSPQFTQYNFNPNGKLSKNTEYLSANGDGTYNKYFDKNGKQLTVKEYIAKTTGGVTAGQLGDYKTKEALDIKVEQATPQEQQQVDKQNNEQFDQLVKDTYLARRGATNLDPKMQQAILSSNNGEWNSPTYRKAVYEQYNAAVKNFATVENQLWTKRNYANIKEIGDINVPKGENGNSVLARNLNGRTLDILTNDKDLGINTEGIKDVNTLISKIEEEGYYFKGATDNGLLKINPKNTIPASTITMEFKDDKNQKTKFINVAVGIGDADKKPLLGIMQKVGQAYLSGNGGFVPVPGLGKAGFKVINVPSQVVEPGSTTFMGLVQEVDSNGNNVGNPTPVQDWLDYYISRPAVKTEANSFLINK